MSVFVWRALLEAGEYFSFILKRRTVTLRSFCALCNILLVCDSHSAIVSATLKCLMKFYNITDNVRTCDQSTYTHIWNTWNSMERWSVDKDAYLSSWVQIWVFFSKTVLHWKSPWLTFVLVFLLIPQDLPKPIRANFILNVETDELFITAGLQDRVVQVSLMTHGAWTCLSALTVKWQTLLLCLAGVWRLSVHGFQQGAHGRARLRYWPPCQRTFISCKIKVVVTSCVCVCVVYPHVRGFGRTL